MISYERLKNKEDVMKGLTKLSLAIALVGSLAVSTVFTAAKETEISQAATSTGYTSAADVNYVRVGNYIANWGTRGEESRFLSTYAESFYTGSYVYDTLSAQSGGTSQSNAHTSILYESLQTLMESKHSYIIGYQDTRDKYCYTDCENGDYDYISSFYSGKQLGGAWGSSPTWNREHCWPKSKCFYEKTNDGADIMMLRPTWEQENSSRGNTAYGESSEYFNPDCETPPASVKGDCARITLYGYVRWGNTGKMWGTSGVMESMSVLLRWMEEDPVDTWEMGRNDAVQAITGTRNVFVDYPEYAWLLFGKEIPKDMVTPSGKAAAQVGDSSEESSNSSSSEIPDSFVSSTEKPDSSVETPDSSVEECLHEYSQWYVEKQATETEEGLRWRFCNLCLEREEEIIPKLSTSSGSGGCDASLVAPVCSVWLVAACAYVYKRKRKDK